MSPKSWTDNKARMAKAHAPHELIESVNGGFDLTMVASIMAYSMKVGNVTVHGFRFSFRDWAGLWATHENATPVYSFWKFVQFRPYKPLTPRGAYRD
jgi:hypothetical protein